MLEVVGRFARQVVPSVVATIIAALLISALNYAFSQKVGTVKTNGIASLSGATNATGEFVFTEPQRQLEKVALIEAPKEQMQAPKAARPATAHRAAHEPDALEPARAALARNRPAAPPSADPPLQPPPVVMAPPVVTYQVVAPTSAPPVASAAPAVDLAPRPPADIPQAAPTEFRSAQRNSLFGEIFDAIRN